ncbi:MAG: RluA family pseudouridine synthase [Planctomycetota bacterium]
MPLNRGYSYRHVVQQPLPGESVCEYLARRYPHSTEQVWREEVAAGGVSLERSPATADQAVRAGQTLVWNRRGWEEEAVPLSYELIEDDSQLLVVNKPSGLPTLPGGGFFEHTLLRLIQERFSSARPVHRLGRGTSGLVLFAMTSEAASLLGRSWPQVVKEYWAVAEGLPVESSFEITTPIGPVEHPRLGTIHAASVNGKLAQSLARVVARDEQHRRTLFAVRLGTGRPHQIRIHLATIGHPLVGDPIYSIGGLPREHEPGLPGQGGYQLHARRLKLKHPQSGQWKEWSATPPSGFLDGFEIAEPTANA